MREPRPTSSNLAVNAQLESRNSNDLSPSESLMVEKLPVLLFVCMFVVYCAFRWLYKICFKFAIMIALPSAVNDGRKVIASEVSDPKIKIFPGFKIDVVSDFLYRPCRISGSHFLP